ncbi:MAG: DUF1743 domain-containing protein [Promethearchaeota archaeon]
MSKILEKRRLTIQVLRKLSATKGTFTINDVKEELNLPRSTVQDWISRFLEEGTVTVVSEASGRKPATYKYSARPVNPCKKILTTVDEDAGLVEIYHFCESMGAKYYCSDEYRKQGLVYECDVAGNFLRQKARIGSSPITLNPDSRFSIGIEEVSLDEGFVVQTVKSIPGGPAVAVTSTMGQAKGVLNVEIEEHGNLVVGRIRTRAYRRVLVGVDDTDAGDDPTSATWEVSMKLLNVLEDIQGVEPLNHKLVRLNPAVRFATGGNVAAFIELAVLLNKVQEAKEAVVDFLRENVVSDNCALAWLEGLVIPRQLEEYANAVRQRLVSLKEAKEVAHASRVERIPITGELGFVGALAAVAFVDAPMEVLMDPSKELKVSTPSP